MYKMEIKTNEKVMLATTYEVITKKESLRYIEELEKNVKKLLIKISEQSLS